MIYLLITTATREGVYQRQLINLDRVCKMQEVNTEQGPRTVIKMYPDEERPTFALETIDQIMNMIGSPYIAAPSRRKKAR